MNKTKITVTDFKEAEALIAECDQCIAEGRVDNFASYEEGVRDALNWALYGFDKPSVGREV